MKFDFAKTLSLVKGGLTDHQATWESYLGENQDWQYTATVLTGPLIVAHVVLSVILARMIGGFAYLGYHSNFFAALFLGLLMACVGFIISVFVFNFLAGIFKGKSNFSRAFAALSLAAIPSWIAAVLGSLVPGFGFLIILAGFIISLVFMYKIMPLALDVPDDKRAVHFISSLVAIVILNMIIASIIGAGSIGNSQQRDVFTGRPATTVPTAQTGWLGEIERQNQLMEAAESDTFNPPADGKLTESQVVAYTKVLSKTHAIHAEYKEKMQKLSEDLDAKEKSGETPTVTDLSNIYSGISGVVSTNNAEMEVVMTGKGNWAEHQWVKEQLRIAKIQQGDGSEEIAHNYELFEEYEESIEN